MIRGLDGDASKHDTMVADNANSDTKKEPVQVAVRDKTERSPSYQVFASRTLDDSTPVRQSAAPKNSSHSRAGGGAVHSINYAL
jgi:hypothetical protein